jgi:uncharacterized protein YndB with AHSA1/START domain
MSTPLVLHILQGATPQEAELVATATEVGSAVVQSGVSVIIERPVEEVFAALTDVARHTEWARGPAEINDVSDNPARLGTTWEQVTKLLGKRFATTMRVNAYEENKKFGFESDKPFSSQFLFTVVPVDGGTELQMQVKGEPANFFGKMTMPLVIKSVERQMESDLLALKAILENQN